MPFVLRRSGILFAALFTLGYLLNVVVTTLRGESFAYTFFSTNQLIVLASIALFALSAFIQPLRWLQPAVFLVTSPITIMQNSRDIYGLGYFVMGVVLLERAGFFVRHRRAKTVGVGVALLGMELAAAIVSKSSLMKALAPTFFILAFGVFLWFLYKDRLVILLKEPKPRLSLVERGLTTSERSYILALIEGKVPKEIGADYDVAESTVRNTLARAYKKLEVADATELAVLAATHEVVA